MLKLKFLFSSKPLFIYLLPLFFVLHGFTAYYFLVPIKEAIAVLLTFLATSQLFTLLFWLFYRNWIKAALAGTFLIAFHFFFGNIHDGLKEIVPHSFLTKYSFLLPFTLVLFIAWMIYLKRSKQNFIRLTTYLNWLLLLIIFIDIGSLGMKAAENSSLLLPQPKEQLRLCDTCQQPDIYLVVADEYPGKQALADLFLFDNSSFEKELKQRGFHIVDDSRSNYNWTPYSLASTLNMNYLQLKTHEVNMFDMLVCEDEIKKSSVIQFFDRAGYTVYNHSIFAMNDKPSPLLPIFLSPRKRLITSPTFTARFQKDLGFHFKTNKEVENSAKTYLLNTLKADSLTKNIAATKANEKKFVYTHLLLPHHPYFFDSTGKANPPEALEDDYKLNKQAFISYLKYSNKKLLELIDHIRTVSKRPPVIILMSDHGFRQLTDTTKNDSHFMNLNAVLLPGNKGAEFYEGMSNVNGFRILLNTLFEQQLPLLRDSSIFLWEK